MTATAKRLNVFERYLTVWVASVCRFCVRTKPWFESETRCPGPAF